MCAFVYIYSQSSRSYPTEVAFPRLFQIYYLRLKKEVGGVSVWKASDEGAGTHLLPRCNANPRQRYSQCYNVTANVTTLRPVLQCHHVLPPFCKLYTERLRPRQHYHP